MSAGGADVTVRDGGDGIWHCKSPDGDNDAAAAPAVSLSVTCSAMEHRTGRGRGSLLSRHQERNRRYTLKFISSSPVGHV